MAKTNWRLKTEQAKHIFRMAEWVNMEAKTWGDRSKIAKKFMPYFEKLEMAEFAKTLPKISLRTPIAVREYGQIVRYI